MTSYRAYRYAWHGKLIDVDQDVLDFHGTPVNNTQTVTLKITNNGRKDLPITSFVSTDSARFAVDASVPLTIRQGATVTVQVHFRPTSPGLAQATIYVRSGSTNDLVARAVQVEGVGVGLITVPATRAPRGPSLAQSRPNPAHGGLVIPFSIPRPGHVTLRVYDSSGRLCATLLDGSLAAGDHSARWDGTRESRGRAAPGEYLYELRAFGQRMQRRMILIR
jgi:hypothetical protein